jgi:hypothetical protein
MSDQADCEADFRQRIPCANCAESICRGEDYLDIGAPRFQTFEQLWRISRNRITGAFHQHSVGWQREAEIEFTKKNVHDPFATHRICGRKTEINAIESQRRPEIQVSRYLRER